MREEVAAAVELSDALGKTARRRLARGEGALMPSFRPGNRVPDLGSAVGALIDEVDLRHAPTRFDLSDEHGKQSHAAGADHRNGLDVVMLDEGWYIGSLSR